MTLFVQASLVNHLVKQAREKALMTRNREVRYLTIFVQSLLHIGPNILYSKMYKTSRITTTAIHGK